jgi:HK97 family phage major capsid protein
MSTTVLSKEWERLATRNADLLNTDDGEGTTLAHSKELAEEFDANLVRLEEIKGLLEKEDRFDVLQKWASTPERKSAVFMPEAPARAEQKDRPVSAGRELLESREFKAWLDTVAPNGQISDGSTVMSPKFELKAAILGSDVAGAGAFFRPYYDPTYTPYVQAALTVRDLVINANTDADLISYTRAVAHTNAAAETAEATTAADAAISGATPGPYVVAAASGAKPEGAFTWVIVTTQVQAIAEGVPITRRALMNGGQMQSVVDDQLRFDIASRINSEMIAGNGTDPNFRGIRNTVGITTQAFTNNVIETLRRGKTKVSDPATGSGKIPTGAVLNPTDMTTLDLFRVGGSTTTDGPFLLNPYADRPQRLWGMTLVEEPGMTAAKALVGFFRDAVLWDRQVTTVQVFDQHKDWAARNLLYMLAEWWGAFGVYQPKSFCDCTTS